MKPCLECNIDNADDATTCAACGGGSFQHVVDAETEARTAAAEMVVLEALLEIDAGMRLWASYDPAELAARWSRGERPPVQCIECPAFNHPCKSCWVTAGLREEDYESAMASRRAVPLEAETQPGGVDTQSPPPPTPENVAADIEHAVQAVETPLVPTDAAVVLREDFKPDAEAAAKMHEALELSMHPSDPPGNGHDGDIADVFITSASSTKREKKRGSK